MMVQPLQHGAFSIIAALNAQYRKLVAAQSCHGVFDPHAGFKPGGDDFQHRIAHRMPERVVDVLEVIQVEEQQGPAHVMPRQQGALLGQAIHQQGPVGQVGERVVIGQMTHLCLRGFQLTDVTGDQQQASGVVEGDAFDGDLHVKQIATA